MYKDSPQQNVPLSLLIFQGVNYPLVCHLSLSLPCRIRIGQLPQFRPLCCFDPPSNWGCPTSLCPHRNEWPALRSSKETERPHLSPCQIRALLFLTWEGFEIEIRIFYRLQSAAFGQSLGFKGFLVTAAVQGTFSQNLSPLTDLANVHYVNKWYATCNWGQVCRNMSIQTLSMSVIHPPLHSYCPWCFCMVHPDFPKLDRALSQIVAIWKGGFTLSFLARLNFRHFSH